MSSWGSVPGVTLLRFCEYEFQLLGCRPQRPRSPFTIKSDKKISSLHTFWRSKLAGLQRLQGLQGFQETRGFGRSANQSCSVPLSEHALSHDCERGWFAKQSATLQVIDALTDARVRLGDLNDLIEVLPLLQRLSEKDHSWCMQKIAITME